jgi:hypothetical protein
MAGCHTLASGSDYRRDAGRNFSNPAFPVTRLTTFFSRMFSEKIIVLQDFQNQSKFDALIGAL